MAKYPTIFPISDSVLSWNPSLWSMPLEFLAYYNYVNE